MKSWLFSTCDVGSLFDNYHKTISFTCVNTPHAAKIFLIAEHINAHKFSHTFHHILSFTIILNSYSLHVSMTQCVLYIINSVRSMFIGITNSQSIGEKCFSVPLKHWIWEAHSMVSGNLWHDGTSYNQTLFFQKKRFIFSICYFFSESMEDFFLQVRCFPKLHSTRALRYIICDYYNSSQLINVLNVSKS